jgi:drug/metabolite transporter (DMT)-like permease
MDRRAVALALLSAALFGVSTPMAKALLGAIDPAILAGLLYCSSGFGIAIVRRFGRSLIPKSHTAEVALRRNELPWLLGAIVAGGIVGPLLLMLGLARTEAATASLLLTLEGAATALIAWFIFQENFDRRIALGMASLVAGAIALSWSGQPTVSGLLGPFAVVGACIAGAWITT